MKKLQTFIPPFFEKSSISPKAALDCSHIAAVIESVLSTPELELDN